MHFKRNILNKAPKKDSAEFWKLLKRVFDAATLEDMRQFKAELVAKYTDQSKYQAALKILEDGFEDTIQYMAHPENLRVYIRSTNWIERLNQEVRRREQVIRVFPNTQSAFRLIGAVLMQYQETIYNKHRSLNG